MTSSGSGRAVRTGRSGWSLACTSRTELRNVPSPTMPVSRRTGRPPKSVSVAWVQVRSAGSSSSAGASAGSVPGGGMLLCALRRRAFSSERTRRASGMVRPRIGTSARTTSAAAGSANAPAAALPIVQPTATRATATSISTSCCSRIPPPSSPGLGWILTGTGAVGVLRAVCAAPARRLPRFAALPCDVLRRPGAVWLGIPRVALSVLISRPGWLVREPYPYRTHRLLPHRRGFAVVLARRVADSRTVRPTGAAP